MPLTAAALKSEIKSQFSSKFTVEVDTWSQDQLDKFADALASAIVTRILADMQILPGTFTAPPGGGPIAGIGVPS